MKKIVLAVLAAAAFSGRADLVRWEFPRTGGCHEGLAFSDGVTGVLVWGGGDTLNLTLGRADLWDHRGGCDWRASWSYTNIVALVRRNDKKSLRELFRVQAKKGEPGNPLMLPLGRLTVKVPGATVRSGTLDPLTGFGTLAFDAPQGSFAVALAMGKKSRAFAMRFPKDVVCEVTTIPSMERPGVRGVLAPIGFRAAEKWNEGDAGGFVWRLPADRPVSVGWIRRGNDLVVATDRTDRRVSPTAGYEKIADESRGQWSRFWSVSARVDVPDAKIREIYEYGLYRFGAMTDPDGVPAGLQGPWLEDDKMIPWNGDYHFNVNVQECYSPAFRSGHPEHLLPLFRMIRSWWPRLRENARLFCGVEDGFTLPHSVDDRGHCIGGFWSGTIDHASTAWVADMMFRYVKYTRDRAFLKSDALPFLKGTMNVYRAMMDEDADGKFCFPIGSSPEWGAMDGIEVGRNPSFQLAAAHRVAMDLIEAAAMLGEKPDPMWLDVRARLPPYTPDTDGIQIFEHVGLKQSHRHHSHMAGLYPFNTLDLGDPATAQAVQRTYYRWIEMGTGWWSGWCVPWASILHTHIGNPDMAVDMLHNWKKYFTNDGHGSRHDIYRPGFSNMTRTFWDGYYGRIGDKPGQEIMQMDGMCGAVTAVLELMVHEVGGTTRYFPGCPAEWKDVSFEGIRHSDGTTLSGRRTNGVAKVFKTEAVTFRSTADGSLQPAYAFVPAQPVTEPMPLVVSLHTWSMNWRDGYPRRVLQRACLERGWALVHPDFRGANERPSACGSATAMQDVVDAIDWMKAHVPIDADRVFVVGCSGGGHMTLQMVAHHPELFAAAFAGCPISDLAAWHAQSVRETNYRHKYAVMMEKSCGGAPAEKPDEYARRSPLTRLAAAKGVPVYICEGIHDGHTGSVPVSQALNAFNALARENDRLSAADIAAIDATEKIPAGLGNPPDDPLYGPRHRLLFARTSGNAKVAIFEASHAGNLDAAVDFFGRQRRGQLADWTVPAKVVHTSSLQEATR